MYTDGLTEARTPDGAMLGEEGLMRHLATVGALTADDLLGSVEALLSRLGDGVSDDTALLALSVPSPSENRNQENR